MGELCACVCIYLTSPVSTVISSNILAASAIAEIRLMRQQCALRHFHNTNATRVSKNLHPGRSFHKRFGLISDLILLLRVDERPNHTEKVAVLKVPVFVWTGPKHK